ncbi:type II secretion system F family protein [Omnitrophica bacterium]|nr:type II secretion system F family protein [Candidatus Omnitrophota bacterium]
MPTYNYRAKKGSEGVVEGKIDARTEKEAIEKLGQIGYLPIRIEEAGKPAQRATFALGKVPAKIKSRQITIFSRELASLLKSGVPILNAIDIISEQSEDQKLRNVLRDVYSAIRDGDAFSSVLSRHPNIFPPLYVAMIRAGENSGALSDALLRIADHRAKQEEIISRFRMASIYPILMALVGLATVIFMLTFVMPRLMQIFLRIGQELPLPTQILISISTILRERWQAVILLLLVLILILRGQTKTRAGRFSTSLLKLRLPLFGKFMLKAELARFGRTLELLIRNGIPILRAINIAIPVLDNEIIKNQLKQSYKDLEQGGSFGRSLKNSALFPAFMSNLIIVGEESGKLEEALAEVSTSYERDVDEAVKIMSNLLEPLMILVMGLIVGFIVIAMLLPIFEINL